MVIEVWLSQIEKIVPDDAPSVQNCEWTVEVVGHMSLDEIKIKESIEEKGRGYIGPVYTVENIWRSEV